MQAWKKYRALLLKAAAISIFRLTVGQICNVKAVAHSKVSLHSAVRLRFRGFSVFQRIVLIFFLSTLRKCAHKSTVHYLTTTNRQS